MGVKQPRTGRRRPPLPVRDGLNPARIRLPERPAEDLDAVGAGPTTVEGYLRERFPSDGQRLTEKIAAAEVWWDNGRTAGAVTTETPYAAGLDVFLYRDPAPEPEIPFELEILHQDDTLVVVDKPHFLATMPRGVHVVNSAVVRLRRLLDEPDLSPAHRLDRLTAGVLMFTRRPADRGAYQLMFARREVRKTYSVVAPLNDKLEFPRTVRSRLIKERGTPLARETDGEPNAETAIELVATDPALGRGLYRATPATGRTHQLRVHFNSLGIPIVNDPFYPELLDVDRSDFSRPLQLLAVRLELADPFTGQTRTFQTRRTLADWPKNGASGADC